MARRACRLTPAEAAAARSDLSLEPRLQLNPNRSSTPQEERLVAVLDKLVGLEFGYYTREYMFYPYKRGRTPQEDLGIGPDARLIDLDGNVLACLEATDGNKRNEAAKRRKIANAMDVHDVVILLITDIELRQLEADPYRLMTWIKAGEVPRFPRIHVAA